MVSPKEWGEGGLVTRADPDWDANCEGELLVRTALLDSGNTSDQYWEKLPLLYPSGHVRN